MSQVGADFDRLIVLMSGTARELVLGWVDKFRDWVAILIPEFFSALLLSFVANGGRSFIGTMSDLPFTVASEHGSGGDVPGLLGSLQTSTYLSSVAVLGLTLSTGV